MVCIVGSVLTVMVPKDSITITTEHETVIVMDMTNTILPRLVGIEEDDAGIFELNGIKYNQFEVKKQP